MSRFITKENKLNRKTAYFLFGALSFLIITSFIVITMIFTNRKFDYSNQYNVHFVNESKAYDIDFINKEELEMLFVNNDLIGRLPTYQYKAESSFNKKYKVYIFFYDNYDSIPNKTGLIPMGLYKDLTGIKYQSMASLIDGNKIELHIMFDKKLLKNYNNEELSKRLNLVIFSYLYAIDSDEFIESTDQIMTSKIKYFNIK